MKKILLLTSLFIGSMCYSQEFELEDAVKKLNNATSKLISSYRDIDQRIKKLEDEIKTLKENKNYEKLSKKLQALEENYKFPTFKSQTKIEDKIPHKSIEKKTDYDNKLKTIVVNVWRANIRNTPNLYINNVVKIATVGTELVSSEEINGFYKIADGQYVHKTVVEDYKLTYIKAKRRSYTINNKYKKVRLVKKGDSFFSIGMLKNKKWYILKNGNLIYRTNIKRLINEREI